MQFEMFRSMLVNGDGAGATWYRDEASGYMAIEVSSDFPLHRIRSITFVNTEYTINDEYRLLLK